MTDHERVLRIHKWLERIEQELQQLAVYNHIFWEVQKIVKANKALRKPPPLFFQFIGVSFQVFAASAIRRQADADENVVSLKRFLLELRENPHLISRAYYKSLFRNHPANFQHLPDSQFDRLVGKRALHLNPKKIQKEIDELDNRTTLIYHYCNKMIAHSDERGLRKSIPVLRDIDNCLHFFERLIKRYSVLLAGKSVRGLMPIIAFDWRDALKIAWIPPSSKKRK